MPETKTTIITYSFLSPARSLHMQVLATANADKDLRLPPMEFTITFPNLFGAGAHHLLIHIFLVHHFIHILLAASCQFVLISSVVLDDLPSCT